MGLAGRVPDGLAAYDSVLASVTGDIGSIVGRLSMAKSWLRIVVDDLDGVPDILAEVAPAQLRSGSIRIAVWSYAWLARAHFLRGDWDPALNAAERAVALLDETGHDWLRPLVRWVATAVSAARGDWSTAEQHVARAATEPTDCELMVVTGALATAELAWARGDPGAVLAALAPVQNIPPPRQGIDEPGFWPWPHLYADALISDGRLAEAADFLAAHEQLAAQRGRRSSIARLARARGRLEAACGRPDEAETSFEHSLDQLDGLALPYERALTELAYGQMLRRRGKRRAAMSRLTAARERFIALQARPFIERCDVELAGSGLTPSKRSDLDPARLTRQELAVATRVATGMSNREIATDMTISVKTVQFHVSNIYSKVGVRSRLQLANWLHAQSGSAEPADQTNVIGSRGAAIRSARCLARAAPAGRVEAYRPTRGRAVRDADDHIPIALGLVRQGEGRRSGRSRKLPAPAGDRLVSLSGGGMTATAIRTGPRAVRGRSRDGLRGHRRCYGCGAAISRSAAWLWSRRSANGGPRCRHAVTTLACSAMRRAWSG